MNRTNIKKTKKQIVEYWVQHVEESDLSIDFFEAEKLYWRYGCKRSLKRCHIIPYSLGGKDVPSNFVLLYKRCHLDNPNEADEEIMWDWLNAYKVPFYDTFWNIQGIEEHKKIYSISFEKRVRKEENRY